MSHTEVMVKGLGLALVGLLVGAAAVAGPLKAVLGLIPTLCESPFIAHRSWAQIRADEGPEHLTGQSPLDERFALLLLTSQRQAAPTAFRGSRFPLPAEIWGWDTADHEWEANLILDSFSPLWVIHLAQWVDLGALAGRFRDRGVREEALWGAVVFRHPLDLMADWLRATELAILFEERLLVMCSSPGGVEAILAARAGVVLAWADVPWAVSLAQLLDRASGAVVLVGPGVCLSFSGSEVLSCCAWIPPKANRPASCSWCTGATWSLPSVLRSADRVRVPATFPRRWVRSL